MRIVKIQKVLQVDLCLKKIGEKEIILFKELAFVFKFFFVLKLFSIYDCILLYKLMQILLNIVHNMLMKILHLTRALRI